MHIPPLVLSAGLGVAFIPYWSVARCLPYLDEVCAAARSGAIRVDGQNVFVYYGALADIAFGVGVAGPFASVGAVAYALVPSGEDAHATHRGEYRRLGEAHAAVVAWCAAQGHVYYLLGSSPRIE